MTTLFSQQFGHFDGHIRTQKIIRLMKRQKTLHSFYFCLENDFIQISFSQSQSQSLLLYQQQFSMNCEDVVPIQYLDEYHIVKQLGSGYQAIVYLALDRPCNQVAIKKFKRIPSSQSGVEEQLTVMQQLHHENLIKLISVRPNAIFRNKYGEQIKCFAFVIEYAQGGELFDFIADTGRFSERVSRTYFHQMMNGIHYMHEKGYAHRDIKPQNLLLSETFVLKIADFGFSCLLKGRDGSGVLKTKLGTEGYMAPEISTKEYDGRKVDVFAAGVILFIMYSGNPPFEKASPNDPYYRLIKENKLEAFWESHSRKRRVGFYSNSFRQLFEKMVAFDPNARPAISEIAKHPWVKNPICTHSDIINQFKERRKRLQQILQERRRAKNGQEVVKIESEDSAQNTSIPYQLQLSFSELYQKEAICKHVWRQFSHIHQSDIVVNSKDPIFVLCQVKAFIPRQIINLNLRAHSQQHNEEEQLASGALVPRAIEDLGNKLHVTYHYNSVIHQKTISHCMGAEIEVGKNSEGLTVIHVEPENNHLYYKLIVSNIKQECFA